jgi:endonuclease YncB( thermonuclease family)
MTISFSYAIDTIALLQALGIKYSYHSAKVSKVTDGDTISVKMGGKNKPLRLVGADTPEVFGTKLTSDARKCRIATYNMKKVGQKASDYTKSKIKVGDDISFVILGIDRHNRAVAYLLNHHSLKLILDGYAVAYDSPQFPALVNSAFSAVEWFARLSNRGLWQDHSTIMNCIKK